MDNNPQADQNPQAPGVPPTLQPSPVQPDQATTEAVTTLESQPVSDLVGLTGSNIAPEKKPMLKGLVVWTIVSLATLTLSFFVGSSTLLSQILLLVDLAITVGLFFRFNTIRKIVIAFSILTILSQSLGFIRVKNAENQVATLRKQFDAAVLQLENRQQTPAQREKIEQIKSDITKKEQETLDAFQYAYVIIGVNIIIYSAKIVYLTRPKVKQAFEETT